MLAVESLTARHTQNLRYQVLWGNAQGLTAQGMQFHDVSLFSAGALLLIAISNFLS